MSGYTRRPPAFLAVLESMALLNAHHVNSAWHLSADLWMISPFNLATIPQEGLPRAIAGWKSLQRLDLASNLLQEIPPEVGRGAAPICFWPVSRSEHTDMVMKRSEGGAFFI